MKMSFGLTHSAVVRGASFRNCFVSFPHHWRAFITPASIPVFKLEAENKILFVSWAGHTHDQEEEETILMNIKLLKSNELSEGEVVVVRQVSCPSPCISVSMATVSQTDWEELLMNITSAQEAFLTQLRVAQKNQIIPLWLEGGAVIYLKIHKINPFSDLGVLQQNTQVNILPPEHDLKKHDPLIINPFSNAKEVMSPRIDAQTSLWNTLYLTLIILGCGNKRVGLFPKPEVILRLKPVLNLPHSLYSKQSPFMKLFTFHPALTFISSRHVKNSKYESALYFVCKITTKEEDRARTKSSSAPQDVSDKVLYTIVIVWEKMKSLLGGEFPSCHEIDFCLRHRTCILSHNLRKTMVLQRGTSVYLEAKEFSLKNMNFHLDATFSRSELIDEKSLSSTLISVFTELCDFCPLVFNESNVMNYNIHGKNIDFELFTRDGSPIFLEKKSISFLSLNVDVKSSARCMPVAECIQEDSLGSSVIGVFDVAIQKIKHTLYLKSTFLINSSFIMIEGPKRSGKSTLVRKIAQTLSTFPSNVYCDIISLKLLKGKKIESVQKTLKLAINGAWEFQPSLLILDDLDLIAPVQSDTEEKGPLYEHSRSMAFMMKMLLSELLHEIQKNLVPYTHRVNSVCVVATCCERNDVHSFLSSPNGNPMFSSYISIPPLSKEEKLMVFHSLLGELQEKFMLESGMLPSPPEKRGKIVQFPENEIITEMETLTLTDINSLALRTFQEAKTRWKMAYNTSEIEDFIEAAENKPFLCYEIQDIQNGLNEFISLSSKALNKKKVVDAKKKIGGLRQARESLEEMILWPVQFPSLFSQAKLRLRSGILLYGPPGCGKSLLASSFQNVPHVNFVTVKGPELLSKYIGQSEKSVREVFLRAQNAKPCVLFFDEFESIAPRRGHDNTGVTDRVVNQLLTQMDGVEGLMGVYVVATTSRPDLIDPALLRPGRLDKAILCPLPNEDEREEILRVLSEEMTFRGFVDFKEIAKKTDGLSGADLQSLLSTSQLMAAQEILGDTLYKDVLDKDDKDKFYKESTSKDMGNVSYQKFSSETTMGSRKYAGGVEGNNSEMCVSVSIEHINQALKEVSPSLSEADRLKYEDLNKMFSKNNENKTFVDMKPGSKETLA